MRTKSPCQNSISGLFTILTFLIFFAAGVFPPAEATKDVRVAAPAVSCPSPTEMRGTQCVLRKDETLEKTLALVSGTKLNCQGHKLTPKSTGSGLSIRSQPEVAIFLNGVQNVQIQNCVIDGFDFGIFAIKSKVPSALKGRPGELARLRNKILQNTINARYVAISLASVDNTEIKDNTIKYTTAGGKGIYVGRDSDLNRIQNNTITGDISPTSPKEAVSAPGPVNTSSNPVTTAASAVLITQTLAPEPTLLNAIIGTELFHLPVSDSPVANEDFTEENLFEGNTISFTRDAFEGIVLSIAQRTMVRNNTIRGATVSLRAGLQSGLNGLPKLFPGKCTSPVSRSCLKDIDCNILGTSGSTCPNPQLRTVPVFWLSDHTTIEDNTITGPFNSGIVIAGSNTLIRGNTITGPLRPGATGAGITLGGKFPLEKTTIINRNVISNVATTLSLSKDALGTLGLTASAFGTQISLNDFTRYTTAVRTDIAATITVGAQGNFWDLPCPQGFDPTKVLKLNLPGTAVVTDDHPYGASVARVAASNLPRPCR